MGVVTIVYSGVSTLRDFDKVVEKPIINKEEIIKKPKEEKKIPKKENKKEVKKIKPKKDTNKKQEKVAEMILPDLNLKTSTVLTLFEDVNYNLKETRVASA